MPQPLKPERLTRACDPEQFPFETTEDLSLEPHIIGQPRGTRAIDFGINISSPGYNIYVLGEAGTGRTTAIQRYIQEKAAQLPVPDDWVYVFNYGAPHKPYAIRLPPGNGAGLRSDMAEALEDLQARLPDAFESRAYRDAALEIQHRLETRRDAIFEETQSSAGKHDAAIVTTPEGLQIVPLKDGKPIPPQAFAQLPPDMLAKWKETEHELKHLLNETMYQIRSLERDSQVEVKELVRATGAGIVESIMDRVAEKHRDFPEVIDYIQAAQADMLENIQTIRQETGDDRAASFQKALFMRRYQVNVLVDNSTLDSAPVIVELNPTVSGLLGRIDHEPHAHGAVTTDFSLIRHGALHAANGGFLVLRAKDVFTEPGSWEALKRVLIGGEIQPDDPAARHGSATTSLDAEPISADLKVIVVGPGEAYYRLFAADEDFEKIFKVMADFDESMERSRDNEMEYAGFIGGIVEDEDLLPFNRGAAAAIIEYGSRVADTQRKLTTRFGQIADLVREAHYTARTAGKTVVDSGDVVRAFEDKIFRSNRIASRILENMQIGKQQVDTEGLVTGQVNGLYVSRTGDFVFGQPTRITARTFAGTQGVVQIDREVKLAGPIHNKGVLTITGYLGGMFAESAPLSLHAQITFEQTYSGIEGDSASSTELLALLSSLSGTPIRQSVAVTGSVDQYGRLQAVGGVTHKVEGWFELCRARGLTGDQGVVIPAANMDDLMLRQHVVKAARNGEFRVWAVNTIEECFEILTGETFTAVREEIVRRLEHYAAVARAHK